MTIHGIGGMIASSCLLPHRAGISGFQLCLIGRQIKVSARIVPIHHNIMVIPITLIAIRNAGVMKIRWNSINSEIFVNIRAVHWSVPTVYQSYSGKNQDTSRLDVKLVASLIYLTETRELFWFQRPQVSSESIFPNPCCSISSALVKSFDRQCLPTQIYVVCAVVITYASQHLALSRD